MSDVPNSIHLVRVLPILSQAVLVASQTWNYNFLGNLMSCWLGNPLTHIRAEGEAVKFLNHVKDNLASSSEERASIEHILTV